MKRDDQIKTLIYRAIDQVNEVLRPAEAVAKSPETVLMGDAQVFDSMGFVTFMAALEDNISRTTGRDISVVDAMFADDADRWTVETLAKRIAELVDRGASTLPDESSEPPLVVGFPRALRGTSS
jgi:hypothetical protein